MTEIHIFLPVNDSLAEASDEFGVANPLHQMKLLGSLSHVSAR